MSNATDLILFSGGVDSTVLLKHFLQEKKKVRVLYIEMGWAKRAQPRIKFQNISANNILNYMKEKYGDFQYSQASILTSLDEVNESRYFGTDHQWTAFFGAMFCKNYNIKRMWTGHFSYTDTLQKERHEPHENDTENYQVHTSPGYLNGDNLAFWIDTGASLTGHELEYCTPALNYKGTSIDRFKSKKEAWDSLEPELKRMVRSCISHRWVCNDDDNCYKCKWHKNYNIIDKEGKPL